MKITFWSPVPGQSGTTSNTFAVAAMTAYNEKKKVLLINGQYKKKDMEVAVIPDCENSDILNTIGLDFLVRNAKMRCVEKDSIRSAAISFYSDNLQIITGTTKENKNLFEEELKVTYPLIINEANNVYDYVMVDAPAGKNDLSEMMINESDIVVVNLPQNRHAIDEYFKKYPFFLEKSVYLIGNYVDESRYNLKNLERIHSCMKKNVGAIPFNSHYRDSFSEGTVIKFLQKVDVNNYKDFHSEVLKSVKVVLKK